MTEWQFIGDFPFFFYEGDFVPVDWLIVEFRTVDTGEPFQFVQFSDFLKSLHVQFNGM